jgi:hypothetical protein
MTGAGRTARVHVHRGAAVVLAVAAAGCLVSPDPSRFVDGSRRDSSRLDGDAASVTDLPTLESSVPDGPTADASPPDLAPDAPLATYQRTWVTAQVTSSPGKLWGPMLAYQAATGKVVLYGGRASSTTFFSHTWVYDGTGWQELCDPCPPGPRTGHGLVADVKRGVVVLFGGKDTTTSYNEIWELASGAWQQATPSGTPPAARSGAFVAYDSLRGRTVVFGGRDADGKRLDDLFEYDGAAWHGPLAPAVRPSVRHNDGRGAAFADGRALSATARNRVVIFGGEDASGKLDDCWAWDGSSWTPVCTSCTQTGRTGAALGYDPATGRLVLVNGWTGSEELAGTLEHDGQTWSESSTLPGALDHAGLAFDAGRNRFVYYGGNGPACSGNCGETLEYVAP